MLFSYRERLFCPGPTPLLREVEQRLGESCYHRQADFVALFQNCRHKLARLVSTESLPVLLATSGSGAMEAALVSLTVPHDRVLVLNGGKFGERWQKIAQAYGCEVITDTFAWGGVPDFEQLEDLLRGKAAGIKVFFLQACETSTAVYYPVAEIAALVRQHSPECLIVVDAISSLVAHELHMDKWGIDCVVAASHKGLGLPPGLAFAFLSERARRNFSARPRFYLDLDAELRAQQDGKSRFTPAINTIVALDYVLDRLLDTGTELLEQRHAALARACRAAGTALKLLPFARTHPANSVTALRTPVDAVKLCGLLRKNYRMQFAAGQGKMRTQLLRIAHLGCVDVFDLLTAISAVELALHECQHDFVLGDGVRAALECLSSWHSTTGKIE